MSSIFTFFFPGFCLFFYFDFEIQKEMVGLLPKSLKLCKCAQRMVLIVCNYELSEMGFYQGIFFFEETREFLGQDNFGIDLENFMPTRLYQQPQIFSKQQFFSSILMIKEKSYKLLFFLFGENAQYLKILMCLRGCLLTENRRQLRLIRLKISQIGQHLSKFGRSSLFLQIFFQMP